MKEITIPVTTLLSLSVHDSSNPVGMDLCLYTLCNWTTFIIRIHHNNRTEHANVRKLLFSFLKDHDHILHPDHWEFCNDCAELFKQQDDIPKEKKQLYSYFAWKVKDKILRTV
jgi:hypothetical protein